MLTRNAAPDGRPRTASWRQALRCAAPGTIVAAVLLAPFLNKAFVVDDPGMLVEARQILRTPLRPLSGEICWLDSETCGKVSDLSPGSALGAYFLVPAILLGHSEIVAHAMQLLALCLAILATAMLAFRLGLGRYGAAAAALMVAVSPAVLPFASSALPDILAMTLGVAGLERLCAWKADGRAHQCAAAIACLGLAPCARPHLLVLLAPAALLLKGDGNCFSPRGWLDAPRRYWIVLIAAVLLALAVTKLYSEPGMPLHPPSFHLGRQFILPNARAFLIYLVIAVPFTAPWLVLRLRGIRAALAACLPVAAVLAWKALLDPTLQALWPVVEIVGATALAGALAEAVRKREAVPLGLALWLLVPLAPVCYHQLPLKYLAASAPAVAIVIAGLLERERQRLRVAAVGVLLVASAVLSGLILAADREFAETARRVSAEAIAPRVRSGQRVWCAGQWGFYWYAQEAGAKLSKPGGEVARPGDILVVGLIERGAGALNRFPHRTLLESKVYYALGGRTLSYIDRISLYSNIFGERPWGWAPGEMARYEVWRIDDSQ